MNCYKSCLYILGASLLVASSLETSIESTVAVSDEKRLTSLLVERYRIIGTRGRPVLNASEVTPVELGLGLIQMALDEKDKVLITSMWLQMHWQDVYLKWDPDDYGGVELVRLAITEIWLPDVMLINTDATQYDARNFLVKVHRNGSVSWIPHQIFRSSCLIDVSNFPFDDQVCTMWFASWTHTNMEVDVRLAPLGLDLSTYKGDYKDSSEWDIHNVSARKIPGAQFSPPCEYDVLEFTLSLRRRTVFRSYLLTLPCVFLASLTLVVFCLPPERPDRTSLAMSIFGSFLLLLLIMAEAAPSTASSVPRLGLYYCFNMVLIMLSVFLSTCVVIVHKKAQSRTPVPRWLRLVMLKVLTRLLFLDCPSETEHDKYDIVEQDDHTRVISSGHADDELKGFDKNLNGSKYNRKAVGRPPPLAHLETYFVHLEESVSDIRDCVRHLVTNVDRSKTFTRDSFNSRREWRLVARVLDRFFFLLYLSCIFASILTLFPRPNWGEFGANAT